MGGDSNRQRSTRDSAGHRRKKSVIETRRCAPGAALARHAGRLNLFHVHNVRRIFSGIAGRAIGSFLSLAASLLESPQARGTRASRRGCSREFRRWICWRRSVDPLKACLPRSNTAKSLGARNPHVNLFVAPALRIMRTILRLVVPRTIESSISTTRFPSRRDCTGFSFSLTPKSRTLWLGSIKVRPT